MAWQASYPASALGHLLALRHAFRQLSMVTSPPSLTQTFACTCRVPDVHTQQYTWTYLLRWAKSSSAVRSSSLSGASTSSCSSDAIHARACISRSVISLQWRQRCNLPCNLPGIYPLATRVALLPAATAMHAQAAHAELVFSLGAAAPSAAGSMADLPGDNFLFTSESVNEGHPDKLCDQVSDAVLDACLEQDPDSKVACETATKTGMVMVFGEITTKAKVDYEAIVRKTCKGIGFVSEDVGLDADTCKVLVHIEEQSPDIGQGVHGMGTKTLEEVGAGDQGHMFGYATDETEELMPLTHVLATKLGYRLTEVRKDGTCPWLRPDGKTQVTVEYSREGGNVTPLRVHTILISTQHSPDVTNEQIHKELMEHVIKPVVPEKYLDDQTIFHLNPSGRFVIGGPHGDAGLTGRKIIIDTYGGWGAHGGGAFSGKDPTKVDRSGAYIARQAAKSVVASGLAHRCLVQVSYAIGVPEPLSVHVDTYNTAKEGVHDKQILAAVKKAFDFRPGMIAKHLDLCRGGNSRYQKTAAYGHFGRDDPDFTWETTKKLEL